MADVLLVVAAGPGLGLAVARRFAREGWAVGLVARSAATLAELEPEVRRAGSPAVATATADVADPAALRAAIASVTAELGAATVLVYNGSAFVAGSVLSLAPEALRVAFDVGVTGALVAAQEVAGPMRAAGRGAIVLTGSVAADRGSTSAAAVGVAKAALRNLALSLHKELVPAGVRAVTVTIAGVLQGETALDLDELAERYWQLVTAAEDPGAQVRVPG